MTNQTSLEILTLKGVGQLLKESWNFYFSKIKTLLGIMAVPVGFSLFLSFITPLFEGFGYWILIYPILFLVSLFLQLLAIPALLCHIRDNTGFRESYQRGLKIFKSFIWVYFLVFIIVTGGFLLLIIPGILFSIWFSLAFYTLIFEERKGTKALRKSKELVTGRWWSLFWRLSVFTAISFTIFFLIFFLINFFVGQEVIDQIGGIIGDVFLLFITPFALIYWVLIYKNLLEMKKEVISEKPSKKSKYIFPAILGSLIFIAIISFTFLNLFLGRDEPWPEDNDLWLQKIEIPKEENAFYYFTPYFSQSDKEIILRYWPEEKEKLKEEKEIYWPVEQTELIYNIIQGKEWDTELVKDLLKNNEQVFRDFEKAAESPYFQVPIYQNPAESDFIVPLLSLSTFRTIAKLNLIKAAYLFQQGQEREAFDQTIKVIKMGQMMENSPRPALIDYLVGMAIKGMSLESLRKMIPETNFSSEIFKNYIVELEQFKENEKGLITIFKMEYMGFTNTKKKFIDPIIKGKISNQESKKMNTGLIEEIPSPLRTMGKLNYFYKPNQTQRMFADFYRTNINNASKIYCREMEFPEIKPSAPYSKIKMIFTENLVGKILHDIIIVSLGGVYSRKCLEDFSISGTQILMAIKAYKIENNKLPNSLNELLSKYLLEIPKDPFDGNLIRYSQEKNIIYSVGSDLIDSGGSEGEDWQKMADPTFKIEF